MSQQDRAILAKAYARHMGYGILWAVVGAIITIATFETSSKTGFVFIAYGAIVWGIIDFFRGFFGWIKYKD